MPTKATLWATVALTATLVLGAGKLMMGDKGPEKAPLVPTTPLRRVSIWLFEPASRIKGVAVPSQVLGAARGSNFFQINEPAIISVTLPGGKEVTLSTKTAFITTEVDVRSKTAFVVNVALLPLPKAVPYGEAVAEVHRLLREMGVEPDEAMRKQMTAWPGDSGPLKYGAGMWFSDRAGLGVELRSTIDNEWFAVFNLAVPAEATRSFWDPSFKATTKLDGAEGKSTKIGQIPIGK